MKKKDFLATLKAMPDCEEKDNLLKAMETDIEDDDEGNPDESVEKSLKTKAGDLSKALDELEKIQGQTAPAAAPLGQRLGGSTDVSLAKSMDATGFVKSLVEQVTAHADDVGAGVAELSQQQAINNDAVLATGKLVLGLAKSLIAQGEKLDRLMAQASGPAQPRTVTTNPLSKSFNAGGGGNQPAGLSKGQLANAINGELKKSLDAGDNARAHQLQNSVVLLTSTGCKDPVAQEIEASTLRQAKG